ncbi:MAG: AbrB family transcriptional regulator [Rhodospirillales bacterium]|nr:AbrB family transcriptional regulator [Rhodospirillales bacterium]
MNSVSTQSAQDGAVKATAAERIRTALMPVAILIGACAGAFAFRALDLPLAYILGAMVGASIVTNLLGPMKGGWLLRRSGLLFVGASVGALLTVDVVAELARLLPVMVAVALASNAVGVLLSFLVARIAGTDGLTGLLSCLPAGMSEMASLAQEVGADEHAVTVIHTLRVVLVLTLIPLWLGLTGTVVQPPQEMSIDGGLAVLLIVVVSALISAGAKHVGVLNPWVVVPMLLCLALAVAGFHLPPVPPPVLIAAQIAIGASLGLRFRLRDLSKLPRAAAAGLVSGLILIGVAFIGFTAFVEAFSNLGRLPATMAVAPGGLGEMIASASALGLLPAAVAGFQLTRSILTNVFTPPLIRLVVARRARKRKGS